MKKLLIYAGAAFTLLQVGCTKDFDEINTDPTQTSEERFNANYLLANSQATYATAFSGYNGGILFQSGWVQLLASTSSGSANYYSNADKYVASGNTTDYMGRSWNEGYRSATLANEMGNLTADKPEMSNLHHIATIMKVLAITKVSDIYGDAPYTMALKGKTEQITAPAYDAQQTLFTTALADLDAAVSALDPAGDQPIADAFYTGDISKWKKFGNSLMVKIAMRLTKADENTAKTYVEKAVAGGTFTSVEEEAFLKADLTKGFSNNNANALRVTDDLYQVRWSKTYIDYLRANDDPRLGVIAEVPAAGLTGNQSLSDGDATAANQIGLPNGYDLNGGATDIINAPGYPGGTGTGADETPIGRYSRPRGFYRDQNGPTLVLTYAETELLLAEAALRGWSTGASAAEHYENGVSAALQSLAKFGAAATISAATADAYAAAHALDESSTENALKMINEQIWATLGSTLNFVDAWLNWKRSGYPVLAPVNFTGSFSAGNIPRRQPYPVGEASVNTENYNAAVNGLTGGDTWTSRVWWDK